MGREGGREGGREACDTCNNLLILKPSTHKMQLLQGRGENKKKRNKEKKRKLVSR